MASKMTIWFTIDTRIRRFSCQNRSEKSTKFIQRLENYQSMFVSQRGGLGTFSLPSEWSYLQIISEDFGYGWLSKWQFGARSMPGTDDFRPKIGLRNQEISFKD